MRRSRRAARAFSWLGTGGDAELDPGAKAHVADELADVLICAIRLADALNIDLLSATRAKIEANRAKYPADQARGSARKYTAYARDDESG